MIQININEETVVGAQEAMRALLNGMGGSTTAISTGTVGTANTAVNTDAGKGKRGGKSAATDKPNISTGEERADPATSATDQVQDAKDEAADTKAAEPEPYKFSHDSVRAVLGGYVQAYGMAAAQEDGAKLLGFAKVSEVPDDQKALAKAVLDLAKGIETNPHKRDPSGDGITKEKIAELNPIVLAAQKVA